MAHRRASCTLTLLPRNPSLSLAVGMSNLQRESGLRGRPRGRSRRRSECQQHSTSQVPGVSIESEGRSSPGASPVRAPNPGIYWSQPPLLAAGRRAGHRRRLLGEPAPPVLALPVSVCHRLDGSESFCAAADSGHGAVRFVASVAYWLLQRVIIIAQGEGLVPDRRLARSLPRARTRWPGSRAAGRRPLDNSPDRGNIPVQPLGCPGTPDCPARAVGRIGQAALNTGD